MRTLTRDEIKNILLGCSILGTGGGGTMDEGMRMVDEAFAAGKRFRLASFDEAPEGALVGTPYGCGAISPLTEEDIKKYARLPIAAKSPFLTAIEALEKVLGRSLDAVISTELGGMNTASAFYTGAMTDRYIMDGDPAGRSVPALQHSTYFLSGIPMCPMAVANKFGECAIFTSVVDDARGEDLVRALAVASQNMIAVVDHVNTVGALKNSVITGAISSAERLGQAFRNAVDAGEDCALAAANAGGGKQMLHGVVKSCWYETRDGYTFGDMLISGSGAWAGRELKVWFQNENIISWLDGEIYVTVPDLVIVIDMGKKFPLLNPYAKAGIEVSVICLPAPAAWTTERGLEVFGPKSFGYDVDWIPFCG
jgi:DUF917 family protein